MHDEERVDPAFIGFDDLLDRAIKEAGYLSGYKRLLPKLEQLEDDVIEEGLEIVRKVYNVRQSLYRSREEFKALTVKRTRLANKGVFEGEEIEALDKELKLAENKMLLHAFDIVRLREPFDEFLILNSIDERKPYNKKPPKPKKVKND